MPRRRVYADSTLCIRRVRLRQDTAQLVEAFAVDTGKTTSEALRRIVEDWLLTHRKRLTSIRQTNQD